MHLSYNVTSSLYLVCAQFIIQKKLLSCILDSVSNKQKEVLDENQLITKKVYYSVVFLLTKRQAVERLNINYYYYDYSYSIIMMMIMMMVTMMMMMMLMMMMIVMIMIVMMMMMMMMVMIMMMMMMTRMRMMVMVMVMVIFDHKYDYVEFQNTFRYSLKLHLLCNTRVIKTFFF